jgi:hypothetical protein
MKTFSRWSASQVDTYNTCNRKWWFNKILGIETPPHPSAVIGTEVHAQLEAYLEEKAPADSLGPIARTALPFAPKPGTVYIEQSIEELGLVAGGLPALGYIDVLDLTGDIPQVLDWKTTSNFRYAKTEDELLRNVQMSVYARATLAMCDRLDVPEPTNVRVTHVAMLTKAPHEARRTSALMPRQTIHENWSSIERTVLSMRETATCETPDKVTPTKSACSAYGGCPFLDRCRALEATRSIFAGLGSAQPNDNNDNQESTTMSDAKTSLLARLGVKTKAQSAAATTPATPAPVAAAREAPAPAAKPPGNAADALMARLRGSLATPPAPVAATVAPATITPPDAPSDEAVLAHIERADAPVEKAAPAPTSAPTATTTRASGAARRPRNATPRLADLGYPETVIEGLSHEEMHTILDAGTRYASAVEPVEAPVAASEDDARPAPGLGIYTGYEHISPTTGLVTHRPEVDEAYIAHQNGYTEGYQKGYEHAAEELKEAIREEVLASLPKDTRPTAEGLRLYVDCRPLKADGVVELDALLAPLMAQVAANAKVPHYSMIPYAQGPAQVAALVSVKPPTGIIVADTRLPATNAVLEVLLPYAVEVVRGLR